MKITTISGSQKKTSTNTQLVKAIPKEYPTIEFIHHPIELPLFHPDKDQAPYPKEVTAFKQALINTDALIISTPVYLYNIPANLKNALEWISTSGELQAKPVLAITFTPHPSRGEKAMQSLLWSLQALKANVVAQLPLYQTEIKVENGKLVGQAEMIEIIREAIKMLVMR